MNEIIKNAIDNKRNLLETESWTFLSSYGLQFPKWEFIQNKDEAPAAAARVGYPVAVKVVSADIIHKSDVGGVKINVRDEKALEAAFEEMCGSISKNAPGAKMDGWLLSGMVAGGIEIIIGGTRDPVFGPVVLCGLGGVFVEIFRDTSMRLAPVNRDEAMEMIEELKSFPILKGYRGSAGGDLEALADCLVNASKVIAENPEIKEFDLNPVKVLEDRVVLLDARIIL